MQLEDYFEFEKFDTDLGPIDRIRIKGSRIAIEHVLEFFNQGVEPGVIAREIFPTLSPEEVYTTVTYYLHNKDAVDAYLKRGREFDEKVYQDYLSKPPSPVVQRLRKLRAQQEHTTS